MIEPQKFAILQKNQKKEEAPSSLAVLGRYVITPEIFDILDHQAPGKGGEIQLTDAIKTLLNTQKVYAYDFEGIRYDVGDKFGFVKATIDFALDRDELKDQVMTYIKTLVKQQLNILYLKQIVYNQK